MQTSRIKTAARSQKAEILKTGSKTNENQMKRFIKAARDAECSEDEAIFDETLRRLAKSKPTKPAKPSAKDER